MPSRREELAQEFHDRVVAREARAVEAIGRAYRDALERIQLELDRVTQAIEAEIRAGRPAGTSLLWREQRLERLQRQAIEELARAGVRARDLIEDARLDAIRAGLEEAGDLVRVALERGISGAPTVSASLSGGIPTGSVQAAIAASQPATPLANLLASMATTSAEAAASRMTTGIILGQNPRLIAAAMRKELDVPRWQAERLARTEVMRAHREATLERFRGFEAGGTRLVEGWVWYAQTGSCCVACLAMHGSKHGLDERLDGHPNCRCLMLPQTMTWADLGYSGIDDDEIETGSSIVSRMDADELRERFGPGVSAALSSGRLQVSDLVDRTFDPEWGSMRRRRSLASALANT